MSGSLYGDSGDDASDTSSICSERAFEVNLLQMISNEDYFLQDIADILRRMASNEWAERKESLSSLHYMIRGGRSLR